MQLFESLSLCFGNATNDAQRKEILLKGGCGWKEVGPIINEILQNLLLLGVFIAIIMIFYAGYVLVTGQGSADSRSKAKRIFFGIIIGLILLVGSYYIVDFALNVLNVTDEFRQGALPKR